MPGCKNLVGKQFNYLTVLEKTDKRKNGAVIWLCQCKCGNLKEVTSGDLNAGRVTSCGCYNKEKASLSFKDMTGQKFGKLTVLEKTDKRTSNRSIIWKCKCDCGNLCEVSRDSLIQGTQSCGCLKKENVRKLGKKSGYDLTNQHFGKLTAIKLIENRKERTWLCQCDCGNQCEVTSKNLLRGHISSKKKKKKSLGEYLIEKILKENNISFISQYHNNDCKFIDTNYYAYFDFYVDNKYIIEFDGEQHFNPQCFNDMLKEDAEEQFKKTQEHDKFKNQWCEENNIPLIRIPYTHLKNLNLNDLLLETSSFIIKR